MNTFNYFFRSIPEKSNFVSFGKVHISILIVAFIISYIIIKKMDVNRSFELLVGFVLLTQQITLYSWYFITNYNRLTEGLPLYHCRVAILALSLGLIFKIDLLSNIGAYWGIFGSISALLIIGGDPFIFPHVTQFSYFIGHLFLLWGSIYLLFVKKISMTNVDFKNMLTFTTIFHMVVFIINNKLYSNYAYLIEPPFVINYAFNPYVYAFIVIMVFNLVLTLEYLLINNKILGSSDSNIQVFHKF
ncbi:TMEM164-related integral membrane acyltransferase [Intestinibacter sp.]